MLNTVVETHTLLEHKKPPRKSLIGVRLKSNSRNQLSATYHNPESTRLSGLLGLKHLSRLFGDCQRFSKRRHAGLKAMSNNQVVQVALICPFAAGNRAKRHYIDTLS